MSTQAISLLPPDPHMCNGDEKQTRSPLSLYSEYQRLDVELRPPHRMASSHWHGQVEVNVPFDGDVEYLINNEVVQIKQGHITLFWACTPHQLTRPGSLAPLKCCAGSRKQAARMSKFASWRSMKSA